MREGREGLVNDILTDDGVRTAYCFGLAFPPEYWPPEGAILVSGPRAPWQP